MPTTRPTRSWRSDATGESAKRWIDGRASPASAINRRILYPPNRIEAAFSRRSGYTAIMSNALVGKYFIGVHDESMRSGIVEAALGDYHYLVRFDTLIGFMDGSHWPESLAVVAIDDMARPRRDGDEDVTPPWHFFDDIDKRRDCNAWINAAPDRQPCVVLLRPKRED